MTEIIYKLILGLIPVLGVVITTYLIPWIKSKVGSEKLNQYLIWAKQAVQYAEMVFDKGELKKAYCVAFLSQLINQDRIILTDEQIEVIIESAVQELKLAEREVAK